MFRLLVVTVALLSLTAALRISDLYHYGPDVDEILVTGDDVSSPEIYLQSNVVFYEKTYEGLYVNSNGLVSFGSEMPYYRRDLILPINYEVIAIFLADVDTTQGGRVYYRETQDEDLLVKAGASVNSHFPNLRGFYPTSLFIVTWDNVLHYQSTNNQGNTFQLVIATDAYNSFAFLHYPTDGLNWISSPPKYASSIEPSTPAQAGFDAGDGSRSFILPGSGNRDVMNLARWSNINVPGVWLFMIGNTGAGDIGTPQVHDGGALGMGTRPSSNTCAAGGQFACHSDAQCIDYTAGFCCKCNNNFLGNGKSCIQKGVPHRINGKVSGTVNGVTFEDDLHAFILTNDGRAYTAISRLPQQLGSSMRSLYVLSDVIGWMFAVPAEVTTMTGFDITGGEFTRSVMVSFQTGERVAIEQTSGDEGRKMTTTIQGNIPDIALGSKVEVSDYSTTYSRDGQGVINSYQTQTYKVDGVAKTITVDQTITFEECGASPLNSLPDLTLKASRSYSAYTEADEIVRYAMAATISEAGGPEESPCARVGLRCDVKADCVATGSSYQCQCVAGYRGNGERCINIDECTSGRANCHPQFGICTDTEGSFQCACRPGYEGDGRDCSQTLSQCGSSICHEHAQCVMDRATRQQRCQCDLGYSGNGVICNRVASESCRQLNDCGQFAQCLLAGGAYSCQCDPGYVGDGYRCVREDCNTRDECHRNAQCVINQDTRQYECHCQDGYTGDGFYCELSTCEVDPEVCDVNARCVLDPSTRLHHCECLPGYEGDGTTCREEEEDVQCNQVNNCDYNADCIQDPRNNGYLCRCRNGYEGNGYQCTLISDCSRNPQICDVSATCQRSGREYVCMCREGYRGDGYRCTPVDARGSFLMLTQGQSVLRMPLAPTPTDPGQLVLQIPGQTAVGIDVDCYSRYVYWTDVAGKMIHKAKVDGTDSQALLRDLGSPEGVAVDWISRTLYYTDSIADTINVVSLDGRHQKVLFDKDLVNPRGIQVDPVEGYVFWTDWNRAKPKIERASMDGTDRVVIVTDGLGLPNGLALDLQMKQVCWADAGTRKLECVNYDGRGRRLIANDLTYPFGMTVNSGHYYWTDWRSSGVQHIGQQSGQPGVPLTIPPGANGKAYGLTLARDQCPRETNTCGYNNGGCRYLCLPRPLGGKSCTCPDNISEDECNRIGLVL